MDIYNYDRQYEIALKHVKDCKISDRNKKLILDCITAMVLENLSKARLLRYISTSEIFSYSGKCEAVLLWV